MSGETAHPSRDADVEEGMVGNAEASIRIDFPNHDFKNHSIQIFY